MKASELSWGPMSYAVRDGAPKTLADAAFQRIREDIVRSRLKPGEKLQPDQLRDLYGIGLSPVREALSRLASDGLAVAQGQRGFFVAPVSVGELMDVADLRTQFSLRALERSIRDGDETWEAGIVAAYYQLNKLVKRMKATPASYADEWERRNRAFHAALEAACGSPWLLHFCEILYHQSERYRRRFVTYRDIEPRIYEEHRVIMEAALARKAKLACKVLEEHIRLGAESVRALMEKAPAGEGGRRRAAASVAPRLSVSRRSARPSRSPAG
jgi:DNA-binding GntR family transcriptional regulator